MLCTRFLMYREGGALRDTVKLLYNMLTYAGKNDYDFYEPCLLI